jgi:hypothetical protein
MSELRRRENQSALSEAEQSRGHNGLTAAMPTAKSTAAALRKRTFSSVAHDRQALPASGSGILVTYWTFAIA